MTILFFLLICRYLLSSDVLDKGIHFLVFKFAATLKPAPREEENAVKIRNQPRFHLKQQAGDGIGVSRERAEFIYFYTFYCICIWF